MLSQWWLWRSQVTTISGCSSLLCPRRTHQVAFLLAGHTWATPPLNTHTCKSRISSDMVLKLFLLCVLPPPLSSAPSLPCPSHPLLSRSKRCAPPKIFYFFCYCCYYVSLSLSSSCVTTHKTRPWRLRKTRRPRLQLSVALNGVNVEFMLVELNVM